MEMSDPLRHKAVNTVIVNEMAMKFSKVHSPKMKSVYWKHFGFPTNENDHIITKQSVVCVLCHKVLTNHGNTTNLRAHLQHRHKDVFLRICRENDIKVPPRKSPKQLKHESRVAKHFDMNRKIKLEFSTTQFNEDSINNDDHSMLYESMVPITYDDDGETYAKVDATDCPHYAMSPAVIKSAPPENVDTIDMVDDDCGQTEIKNSNYRLDVIEMDSYQLQDALVNLIVKDLKNVSTLYDDGMSQFLRAINGSSLIPPQKKIEAMILELHSDKLTTLADQVKVHSQVKNYSLGFELWTNVEGKYFLSIFYNYTTDVPEFSLFNQLYCTTEYNKFTNIDIIFDEFNLENCSAAIVNYDEDDYLKGFLKSKKIPVILSYSAIVDKCLQSVFALPTVSAVIEEVKEVVTRYASEINSKEVEIPTVNAEFPWTNYELLKFFSETVSWPEDVDGLVCSAKTVIDTLTPLAVTLDTLKGEDIPQSSMVTPISTKILNKQINVTESDDEFVSSIKSTTSINLHKFVLSDDHLTISALLDPRFHRLIDVANVTNCVDILSQKHKKICEWQGYCPKKEIKEKPSTAASRKSNLELFFDIQETTTCTPTKNDTTIENDLNRYRNEVYVSLDESPFVWWIKVGHLYGSLKQLAMVYQCIPCVVNMNFKKSIKQQISEHLKRYMLTGSLIDSILFLHNHTK